MAPQESRGPRLLRRRPRRGHERVCDGTPLLRPYARHGEQAAPTEMAHRRFTARRNHSGLVLLGRIAVDQTHADAHAHLDALTSSLAPWAEPVGLGEPAREIHRQ